MLEKISAFIIETFQTRFARIYTTIVLILGLYFDYAIYQSNSFGALLPYAAVVIATLPGAVILACLYHLLNTFLIPILEVVFRFEFITVRDWVWQNADTRLLDVLLATMTWLASGFLTLILLNIMLDKRKKYDRKAHLTH
jgi:hypothetical protein